MTSLFGKLGFNFDTNKFGDGQYLSPQAKYFLNAAPIQISSWAQSDIANGNVQLSNYYKNPLVEVCDTLISNTANIINFTSTTPFDFAQDNANSLFVSANNLLIELESFKSHTWNISGANIMTSNTDTIPSLETATTVGNQLLRILNVTDGIENTTPLLGSMTSLFTEKDLVSNNATIYSDRIVLNTSVAPNGNCYLSNAQVLSINSHVNILNSFVALRRTSDWNFFANATAIVLDTMKLNSMETMGNTQLFLVNNYIGTDSFKEKKASQNTTN